MLSQMLVAILEDDVLISEVLGELLANSGIEVRTYTSTDSAFAECSGRPPDILIADWCVPGDISTARLVAYLRELNPQMRVVFTSGQKTDELANLVATNPLASFIPKPISFEALVEVIKLVRDHPLGGLSDYATV